MHYLNPLSTLPLEHPDFNRVDLAAELNQYLQRQQAVRACFDGSLSPDELLQKLESSGLDAEEYMEVTTSNIESAIDRGIIFDGLEELCIQE